VGENGRLFRMWKFRTMVEGADQTQAFKHREDPRRTRVGAVLRRWSLDELPNLINVLTGEMSLVGPRPEQPWIVERYEPWQRKRLAVPPGITGWWQVNGRSDLPLHENVEYDIYYIQNYSPLLDLQILWRTIPAVLKGKGAY
jgi:lipopolysaccharide/colanic/teichoic acid biosynthesis glycosyltransferase